MGKKTRISIVVIVVMLAIPVLAMLSARLVDPRSLISDLVQSSLGKELEITGELGGQWGLSPTFFARNLRIANSSWGSVPDIFTAQEVSVSVSLIALLKGKPTITRIALLNPQLWIEFEHATGRSNFHENAEDPVNNNTEKVPDWLDINQLVVTNGTVHLFRPDQDWKFVIENGKLNSDGHDQEIDIDLSGEIQDTPMEIAGKVGDFQRLFNGREVSVALDGKLGSNQGDFSVNGVIQDVTSWFGLNLWWEGKVKNLSHLSRIAGKQLPSISNVAATWELVQPERHSTLRLESFHATALDKGLNLTVDGNIGGLSDLKDMSFTFNVDGSSNLSQFIPGKQIELPLEVVFEGMIGGSRDALSLQINRGSVTATGIAADLSGQTDRLLGDWSAPLGIEIRMNRLESIRHILPAGQDTGFGDFAGMTMTAELNRENGRLNLEKIRANSANEKYQLSATGDIADLTGLHHGTIQLQAGAESTVIQDYLDWNYLSLFDEFSFSSSIEIDQSVVSVRNSTLVGEGDGIRLDAEGTVSDLASLEELKIQTSVQMDNLARLRTIVAPAVPDTHPLSISFELDSETDSRIDMRNLAIDLNDPLLTVKAYGNIRDLGGEFLPELDIELGLAEVSPIAGFLSGIPIDFVPEQIFPIGARGNLGRGQQTDSGFVLSDIKIQSLSESLHSVVTGELRNLFVQNHDEEQFPEGELKLVMQGPISGSFSDRSDGDEENDGRFNGDIDGSLNLILANNTIGMEEVSVKLLTDNTKMQASGSVNRLFPLQSDGFELDFSTQSVGHLRNLPGFPNLKDNPGSASFNIRNNADEVILDMDLNIASSEISGQVIFDASLQPADKFIKQHVTANLASSYLNLDELIEDTKSDRFFPDKPFTLNWINTMEGEVNFVASEFENHTFHFRNLAVNAELEGGRLDLKGTGGGEGGPLEFHIELSRPNQELNALVSLQGEAVDFNTLSGFRKSASSGNSGIFSVDVKLVGSGKSIAEIAAGANGYIITEFSGVRIADQGLELFGSSLFLGVLDVINPLTERTQFVTVECGVIQLEVDAGIAESQHGFAMKTSDVTVLGGGRINFGNERINLIFTPKARKGLGINSSPITNLIKVGGTIGDPDIEANPKGLLKSGIAIGAAFFSGGISLLAQGLYDRNKANSDVCAIATEGSDTITETEITLPGEGK